MEIYMAHWNNLSLSTNQSLKVTIKHYLFTWLIVCMVIYLPWEFISGFSFGEVGCIRTRNKVTCCHFSSDGKLLASAGHDKKVGVSLARCGINASSSRMRSSSFFPVLFLDHYTPILHCLNLSFWFIIQMLCCSVYVKCGTLLFYASGCNLEHGHFANRDDPRRASILNNWCRFGRIQLSLLQLHLISPWGCGMLLM